MADAIPHDAELRAKLSRNILRVCQQVERGKRAVRHPSVWQQRVLSIASISLSSLGSAGIGTGIILQRRSATRHETPFWFSFVALLVSILSQIADRIGVAKHATASRDIAERSAVFEAKLVTILDVDEVDPQAAVSGLLFELNQLFETPVFTAVLPALVDELGGAANERARMLIQSHQDSWKLKLTKNAVKRKGRPSKNGGQSCRTYADCVL